MAEDSKMTELRQHIKRLLEGEKFKVNLHSFEESHAYDI